MKIFRLPTEHGMKEERRVPTELPYKRMWSHALRLNVGGAK